MHIVFFVVVLMMRQRLWPKLLQSGLRQSGLRQRLSCINSYNSGYCSDQSAAQQYAISVKCNYFRAALCQTYMLLKARGYCAIIVTTVLIFIQAEDMYVLLLLAILRRRTSNLCTCTYTLSSLFCVHMHYVLAVSLPGVGIVCVAPLLFQWRV
jgi:hypothetical protein